jgi:outer membrane receptor protein involved in Fe transport
MKTCLMTVVAAFCFSGVAAAQPGGGSGVVVGQVFDADSKSPVEFANVVLLVLPESTQVTGTVTDKTGAFRLDGLKPGRYCVEVSFVGYREKAVNGFDVAAGALLDIGRVDLEQRPVPVQGVEATAERPAISFEADKTVIDVGKLPTASSGTAVDALQNVPAVKVDIEGNVTLRGSSTFTVLVDGRPTPLAANEALKQIPSATIDKIEVITNPSAKYDAEGAAGIINVLLKKQKGRGTSALANADAGLKSRYNGDVLLSYRQGIVSTYAGGQLGHRQYDNERSTETQTFGGGETLSVTQTGEGVWKNLYGGGRAGMDLQFGPRDRSSISGRLGMFDGEGTGDLNVTEERLPADSVMTYETGAGWKYSSRYWFAMADHEHQFDTTGHKLTGRAIWVSSDGQNTSRITRFVPTSDTTSGRRVEQPGPWRRLQFDMDYVLPLRGPGKVEAGYEGKLERMDQDYRLYNLNAEADTYELDERSSHPYYGTQDNHALYAVGSRTWSKLSVKPGLRAEYGTRLIEVLDTAQAWQESGWDLFPSLHLSYSLPANQNVTAGYSRRIDRPNPWLLRPFRVWQDDYRVNEGNPGLLSSYVNSVEAGYELPFGANHLSFQGYWRTTSNMNEWVTKRDTVDSTVLVVRPENIGQDRSLGLELSANVNPTKWLGAFLTGEVYDYLETGIIGTMPFERGALTWHSSLRLTATLPTSTQLQLSGYLSSPTIAAQGSNDVYYSASAAVKQYFLKRALSVTLRCANLLGPTAWKTWSDGPGFYTSSKYTNEGYILSLALSYNFNNFRFDPKMRAGEGVEQEGAGGGGGGGPQR